MGLLEQVRDPDMHVVAKLNEVFKIAKYPDAFIFPMYIKSLIWKDIANMPVDIGSGEELTLRRVIQVDLSTGQCATIGEHFAKRAPAWIRYGSVELMVEDAIKLVQQLKRLHTARQLAQGAH
jgi:hypothetical protein